MLFISVTVHTNSFSILRMGLCFSLLLPCLSLMLILSLPYKFILFCLKWQKLLNGVGLGYVLWLIVLYHFLVALLLLFSFPNLTCLFPLSLIYFTFILTCYVGRKKTKQFVIDVDVNRNQAPKKGTVQCIGVR